MILQECSLIKFIEFGLVLLRFNVPVNNFSVMLGRNHRFLSITSIFWEVNVSCSRTQHGDLSEDQTPDLSLQSPTSRNNNKNPKINRIYQFSIQHSEGKYISRLVKLFPLNLKFRSRGLHIKLLYYIQQKHCHLYLYFKHDIASSYV